jgi:hypothetical protein
MDACTLCCCARRLLTPRGCCHHDAALTGWLPWCARGVLRPGAPHRTAAALLQEGSLDTRTYSKRLLWAVKAVLRGNRADLDRLLSGVAPEAVQRRVVEVLEGLSGPPPPPASRGSTSAGEACKGVQHHTRPPPHQAASPPCQDA